MGSGCSGRSADGSPGLTTGWTCRLDTFNLAYGIVQVTAPLHLAHHISDTPSWAASCRTAPPRPNGINVPRTSSGGQTPAAAELGTNRPGAGGA
jgi:hypothetical protein